MENYFENNIEEINQIISRSKKDKSTTIFRIQKSKVLTLHNYNGITESCDLRTLHGINMHLLSKEGNLIFGSSDRLYLPDVMTRLYQSLDNLLKANKGHKVQDQILFDTLPTNHVSVIDNINLSEDDLGYLEGVLESVYQEVREEFRNQLDIHTTMRGSYAVWLIGNSHGGRSERDEFDLQIDIEIASKEQYFNRVRFSHSVSSADLRNQKIPTKRIAERINEYAFFVCEKFPATKAKVAIDGILLDRTLTTDLIYQAYFSPEAPLSPFSIADISQPSSQLLNESIDKYGIEIPETIELDPTKPLYSQISGIYHLEAEHPSVVLGRSKNYIENTLPLFRNLQISTKNKQDEKIEFSMSDVLDSLKAICEAKGVKTILLTLGHACDVSAFPQSVRISPSKVLVYNEGTLSSAELCTIDFIHMDGLELLGSPFDSISRISTYDLPFVIKSGNAFMKMNENVKIA